MRRHRVLLLLPVAALLAGACGGGDGGDSAGGTTVPGAGATTAAGGADVREVTGSAFGYSLTVSLFGGPPATKEPQPSVTLPAGGSATPVTATAPTLQGQFGPATFFSAAKVDVSTQGRTGAGGSVTSSARIEKANNSGQESFTAASVVSTCTASGTATGSTTIAGGTLQTDNGDGTPAHPPVDVPLDANPPVNKTYEGHIHVNNAIDNFRFVFNEQITTPGGITVNAAHEYLLGPTAKGDVIIGQSRCSMAP